MEDLKLIVQRMIDAGEPEENIQLVIEKFNEPGKIDPIAPGVAVEETAAPDPVSTELQSEAGSLALQETELTTAQSIKNSFSNMFEQLGDVVEFWGADEGQGSALDIATNTVAASIFGQRKLTTTQLELLIMLVVDLEQKLLLRL